VSEILATVLFGYTFGSGMAISSDSIDEIDEYNLREAERSINNAIDSVKHSSEEFDPILDDLFEALNTLQRLRSDGGSAF
jgi:hypothetical protein